MIDFRYHLVSIVSIFLALAVGIVLGAGPLQQQLGQTLTNQVSQLRRDKADLRSQLDAQQQKLDAADTFAAATSRELVGSRLGGRSVVLVVLPGADSSVADDLTAMLRSSGATVNGRVRLTADWADPDPAKVARRDQLSASLGPRVGSSAPASATVDERMGALLARALVVPGVAEADRTTAPSDQALGGLRDAGLLQADGTVPLSSLALAVAPLPDAKASTSSRTAALATWRTTLTALDDASSGAVVAGPTESTEPIGVLGALRADRSASAKVSSVDDVQLVMGQIAVVLALRQQLSGRSGSYGTGVGATGVLPPLPAGVP